MEMTQGNEEVTEKTDGKETAESIFSDTVTLHSVEGDTYRVKFEVRLNCDVSPKSHKVYDMETICNSFNFRVASVFLHTTLLPQKGCHLLIS